MSGWRSWPNQGSALSFNPSIVWLPQRRGRLWLWSLFVPAFCCVWFHRVHRRACGCGSWKSRGFQALFCGSNLFSRHMLYPYSTTYLGAIMLKTLHFMAQLLLNGGDVIRQVMARRGLEFLWIIICALKFPALPPLQVAVRNIFFTRFYATWHFVGQPEMCEVKLIKSGGVISF